MKKSLLFLLLLAAFYLPAQERVWMDNGNPVSGKITKALDTQLEWLAADGVPRTYHRKRFLLIFNAHGDYLVVSELDNNRVKAQAQIDQLYARGSKNKKLDLIVRALPFAAIPAQISYESDEVINYKTIEGNPASINKEQVAAVFYRDGHHEIVRDVVDVAPLLSSGRQQIAKAEMDMQGYKPVPVPPPEAEKSVPEKKAVTSKYKTSKQAPAKTAAVAKKVVPEPVKEKPFLTEQELKEYSEKGIVRVHEFTDYLKIIVDKSLKLSEKNKAVEEAARLFEPNATVAVSGANGVNRYPVREYLTRLKLLKYSKINISWTEVKYMKELKQEEDGSYYGIITGQQVFEGYGAGGKNVVYGDVTRKSVKIKLESYEKMEEGKVLTNWGILLGNIGVEIDDSK